jgi:glutaredoxin
MDSRRPVRPLLLCCAAALLVLFAGCNPPGDEASGESDADTAPASAPAKRTLPGAEPGKQRKGAGTITSIDEGGARQIYYQYVDSSGAVRFVPTLEEVPAEWRSRVGFVELAGPPPGTPGSAQQIRDARARRSQRGDGGLPAAADYNSAEVVFYSADWCGACRQAKAYMNERGIDYDERDIDDPEMRDEMIQKAGPGGIPVFDVNGKILRGFSPQLLEQLIHAS